MPIYEYDCGKCGEFEAVQRISDPPLARCPHCGGRKVRKLISPTSFQLKGSGWYITDYARKGSSATEEKKGEKTESTSQSAPDSKSSGTAGEGGGSGKSGKGGKSSKKAAAA